MRSYLRSAAFALLLMSGCGPQQNQSSTYSETEVRSNIGHLLANLSEAVRQKNVDDFMTLWANSDSLVYTRQGQTFVGWDEIYANHSKAFAGPDKWTTEMMEAFIEVLGPGSGVVTTFSTLASRAADGAEQSTWFTFTAAIEKQGQSWKIVQAHSSYPPTGMSPRGVPEE